MPLKRLPDADPLWGEMDKHLPFTVKAVMAVDDAGREYFLAKETSDVIEVLPADAVLVNVESKKQYKTAAGGAEKKYCCYGNVYVLC